MPTFDVRTLRILEAGGITSFIVAILLRITGLVESILATAGLLLLVFLIFWLTRGGVVTDKRAVGVLELLATIILLFGLLLPITSRIFLESYPFTSAALSHRRKDVDLRQAELADPTGLYSREKYAAFSQRITGEEERKIVTQLEELERNRPPWWTAEQLARQKKHLREQLAKIYEERNKDKKFTAGDYRGKFGWFYELRDKAAGMTSGELAWHALWIAIAALAIGALLAVLGFPTVGKTLPGAVGCILIILLLGHLFLKGGGIEGLKRALPQRITRPVITRAEPLASDAYMVTPGRWWATAFRKGGEINAVYTDRKLEVLKGDYSVDYLYPPCSTVPTNGKAGFIVVRSNMPVTVRAPKGTCP